MRWQPHPEIWVFVALLAGLYLRALRHRPENESEVPRYQKLLFAGGVVATWLSLDYPIHELADSYLYSAHSVQHLTLSLVAPPLLMLGTPPWMLRRLLGRGVRLKIVRTLARPLPALVIFNVMIAVIHWPLVVDTMSKSQSFHVMIHGALVGSALLMWTPVLSPLLELPQLSYPGRMFYLFLQSIVPTVPASFLTFASTPFYKVYAEAPRLFGISALEDLQISGLLMKIGGGLILWTVIAIFFFRWYALEEKVEGLDVLAYREIDHDLNRVRIEQ
jgi:putative membrane protein